MKKNCLFAILIFLGSVCLSSCANNVNLTVPTFSKSKGMRFTAYAGPTVENWAGYNQNINTITEEHYRKLKEAGFNKVIALYEGASSSVGSNIYETIKLHSKKAEKDAVKALTECEKFDIGYYVRDWSFYGLSKNFVDQGINDYESIKKVISEMFTEENPYLSSKSYLGNFASDEPTVEEMERIAWQAELYKEALEKIGKSGEMMVNLLPCYVGNSGISKTLNYSYKDYVDYYFDHLAPLLGYVSYDYYPFKADYYDGSFLRETYLYNLELMAEKCRNKPYELRTFLQDCADWTGLRKMSGIDDLRFQIYTEMAFGSKEIIYYTYANEHSPKKSDEYALMNYVDGTYNWTYDIAKKANNEVHQFEDAFLSYHYDHVMFFNSDERYDNQNFANLVYPIESHDRVEFKKAEQDTLLTTFKNDNQDDAFMLVNFTDPYFKKSDQVTLKFKDAKGLLMYRFGQKVVVNLPKNGEYTFKLYPGEGRFIIPLR